MSEITKEKRDRLRKHASEWVEMGDVCHIKPETMLGLLDALEAAEARAEQAESENTALKEDFEATEKSLKEYSGFFEELCARVRQRFPEQYTMIEGDEYGGDAFGVHELFEFVIDPVINSAREQAEAEVARLTAERDWLAEKLTDLNRAMVAVVDDRPLPFWKEAASKAVDGGWKS